MAQTKAQLLGPVVGDVVMDVSTLSLDAAGNKVGIGHTEPDLTLHVNGVDGLPSSSGSTPTGHLTIRNKATSTKGMFLGVSDASPFGSWIQAQDSANNATNYPLLLNPNGGNVGIGVISPSCILDVQGGAGSTIKNLNAQWVGSGTNSTFRTDGVFDFQTTSGTNRLRIDSSGNVGIGTSAPQSQLDVNGNAVIGTDNVGLVEFTSTGIPYFAVAADASNYRSTRINVVSAGGYADLSFDAMGVAAKSGLPSAGSLVGNIMYLDASTQNVGIGTNTPGDNLEIKTDAHGEGLTVKSTGSTSNAVTFDANRSGGGQSISNVYGRWNGTTVAQMGFVTGVDATNKNDGYIYFGTESDASNGNVNATERLRITSGGDVNIGPSANANGHGLLTLSQSASAAFNALVIQQGNTAFTATDGLQIGIDAGVNAYFKLYENRDFYFTTGTSNTEKLRITSAGDVGIGTTSTPNNFKVEIANNGATGLNIRNTNDSASDSCRIAFSQGSGNLTSSNTFGDIISAVDAVSPLSGHIKFRTNAGNNLTEKLRITSDGTVLMGGQTASYDGAFVNLELRKDSTTVGGSMTLVNDQSATAGATCQIDCYQNYRAAGRIVFGRENANNWQSSASSADSFLAFHTNDSGTEAERVRITSEGTVNINTTADGGVGGFAQPQLYLKTNSTSWTGGMHFEESGGDSLGVINHSSDGFEIAQSYRTAAGSYKPIMFRTSGVERLRLDTAGDLIINPDSSVARAKLDIRSSAAPALNITYPDGSFYRNLGTVGPNDSTGTTASGAQYLHIRLRTIWNDGSMTMFRITGYYSYSSYTESYVGMYRYASNANRYVPYGQIIHNQSRATVHSIYNTNADPGYLVIVCDWGTNYTGLMIEHCGAGGVYASYMQHDLEIIDTKRTSSTSAQW